MYPDKSILIGIYWPAFAEMEHVVNTLHSLTLSQGKLKFKVLVFCDGPDARAIPEMPGEPVIIRNDFYRGKAYCFNRLTSYISTLPVDFFVFMEAGVLLGPDCLTLLLHALEQDGKFGLAGPSTNFCWNEQAQIVPESLKNNYRSISALLKSRYQDTYLFLEPLYSLSDFCYVLKREVIEATGAADEAFKSTCWEMDLNIRAARAGFKGVYVKGAYAERTVSFPTDDLLQSKKMYQDRYCALQKEGLNNYKSHCLGDQCSNFAVPSLIKLKLDLQAGQPVPLDNHFASAFPLVSCIVPTANRQRFITQSIRFFHDQDYPNKELIIVYNEESDIPGNLEKHPNIKLARSKEKSIGAKRNEACRLAKGSIIAQWDDDDIYGSNRLSSQVAPLLTGECEITGLYNFNFYELESGNTWVCSEELFKKLFVESVGGGTLVFLKEVWKRYAVYPPTSLREDADFLMAAIRKGARLKRIDGKDIYIYVRHASNTWQFRPGTYLQKHGWLTCSRPEWMNQHLDFYLAFHTPVTFVKTPSLPLVSCIMPTANRARFLLHSIDFFKRQDYPSAELIIVDDGKEPVDHLIAADPDIRYVRLEKRITIGAKRNYACSLAKGDIVVHWDDDDWYASNWISHQVNTLLNAQADICGLKKVLFFEPSVQTAWQYTYQHNGLAWVAGATMAYKQSFWQKHPFKDIQVGEDNDFVWYSGGKVKAHDYKEGFVSLIHEQNTSPKRTGNSCWEKYPVENISNILQDDWVRYKKIFSVNDILVPV